MKRYFLLSYIFIGPTFICNAQKKIIEYGFQGGVNINSASGNAVDNGAKSTLTGMSIGGHIKTQLSKHFGLKAILAYDRNGWTFRNLTFASGPGDVFEKLNYLNLPLLAEWSFGNKIQFNISGGVFAGCLLSNTTTVKISGSTPSTESSPSDAHRRLNFGMSAGANAQIPVAPKLKLDIGVHNNFGLANTNKSSGAQAATIKLNAFSILAGLTFQMR